MSRNTTATLLDSVRLYTRLPPDITDAQILGIATDEMLGNIVPLVKSVNADYFKAVKDYTISTSNPQYTIPHQAIGSTISEAYLVNSAGEERPLPVVDQRSVAGWANTGSSGPAVMYFRNNKIRLNPIPTDATTLRVIYYIRPGDLVLETAARQLTVVGTTTATISSALGTLTTGVPFDIVVNTAPFPHAGLAYTATVASAALSAISPTLDTDVAVGDWVALAGQSPIPQIPYELHPCLAMRTASKIMYMLGDRSGSSLMEGAAAKMEGNIVPLITPRADGMAQKIVDPDGSWSSLRNGWFSRGF